MFIIQFVTSDINSIITLRTSKNPACNIYGQCIREYKINKYVWRFKLEENDYFEESNYADKNNYSEKKMEFQFLLNNTDWQIGSNTIKKSELKKESKLMFQENDIIFNRRKKIDREKEFDNFLKIYNIYLPKNNPTCFF